MKAFLMLTAAVILSLSACHSYPLSPFGKPFHGIREFGDRRDIPLFSSYAAVAGVAGGLRQTGRSHFWQCPVQARLRRSLRPRPPPIFRS